jgi:hypothetical protein
MLKPYMAGKNLTYEHSVQQERKTHLKNLKSTTSFIVETGQNAPPKKIASIMANPRKKMKEQERYQAIEAENARLLSRMTKIMDAAPRLSVLHRTKVFISNAPTRRNEALHVAKLNQVVLERLNKTGPFYDHKQWAKDRKATEHILGGMGLYPYVPPPAKKADDFFEKDPLKLKSYESKLDEQWAESLSAFASRSSVLDEELEGHGHGRRAVSLTPSSLKRPGNDDWMLPGLGRPGIYSQAKQGKTMQVIPDGRLPYQFSARTPSPKQRQFSDSTIRTDSIPKNVLIAKPAAPVIELDDQVSFEESPDRSGLKSREGRPTNGSRPASAARPGSASAIRPGSASAARPISAQRPTSATKTLTSRPSSANVAVTTPIVENHEPISENALNSEIRAESGQAPDINFESSHNSATNSDNITENQLEHQAIPINSSSAENGDDAIQLNPSADTPTPALDSILAKVEEPEILKDNSENESVAAVMSAIVAEGTDTASVATIDDNSSSVDAVQSNTIGIEETHQPSGGEVASDATAELSSPVTEELGS